MDRRQTGTRQTDDRQEIFYCSFWVLGVQNLQKKSFSSIAFPMKGRGWRWEGNKGDYGPSIWSLRKSQGYTLGGGKWTYIPSLNTTKPIFAHKNSGSSISPALGRIVGFFFYIQKINLGILCPECLFNKSYWCDSRST